MNLPDISAIVAKHNAEHRQQIKVYKHCDQALFSVYAISGGLCCSVMAIFYVGELDPYVDLGRNRTLRKHEAGGLSWAVEFAWENYEWAVPDGLNEFDELIRAEGWQEKPT